VLRLILEETGVIINVTVIDWTWGGKGGDDRFHFRGLALEY